MHNPTQILLASIMLAGIPVQGATEINYWLWDSNQQPSYQACADAFEKENPGIKIKITQTGWFDYWTALNTAFVSGTAPDVFWDHLSRYPEFIDNGLLVDLSPLIARDHVPASKGVDVSAFIEEGKVPGGTFFLPISEHSSDVVRILRATFDSIFLNGEDPAPKLEASNQEINALFR